MKQSKEIASSSATFGGWTPRNDGDGIIMEYNKNQVLDLYKQMLLIRIAEEKLAEIYPKGEMRTPTHFSIGQEAVSVGVCGALRNTDAVFASHRCHAAYLAKKGDLKEMTAELFGRKNGACGGRSGSAHLSCPDNNMFSAPILSAMIPVAVGAGLAFKMDKRTDIAVSFFGDAAVEEGVFSESINFAVVKNIPVLFVCENNFFSTHTHIRCRQPDIPIYKRVFGLGIKAARVDGNNALEVYGAAASIVKKMRLDKKPVFLECITYRYREHVGPNMDLENPYRTSEEVRAWMARDPIKRVERELLKKKYLNNAAINRIKEGIKGRVDSAISFARKSAWPKRGELLKNVI